MTTYAHQSVGGGQSGRVYHLTPSIVLKQPWIGFEVDLEVERDVYERLSSHPQILKIPWARTDTHKFKASKITWDPSRISGERDSETTDFLGFGTLPNQVGRADRLKASNAVLCDFAGSSIDDMKANGVSYERRCLRRCDYTKAFNFRDDLFAFGTVIYELSTRKPPYEDKTDEEVRQLYKKGEFPDVSNLEMGNIIYRCWHDGYENASDILADIRCLIHETQSLVQYVYDIYSRLSNTLKQLFI